MREYLKIKSAKDAALVILTILFLFQIFYYARLIQKRVYDEQEYREVMRSMGVSSFDLWITRHAFITRESIIKLRENLCQPPILNPFAPDMVRYFKPLKLKLNCSSFKKFYFKSYVQENGTESQNLILTYRETPVDLKCCYEPLRFATVHPYKPINHSRDKCIFFRENATAIPADSIYVIIKCWRLRKPDPELLKVKPHHYELLFYVPKPSRELLRKTVQPRADALNVIILGLDEVSRPNFIRLMGKTFGYLKNELEAIDLQGFNKMGDATMNNTLALLTGQDFGSIQRNPAWMPQNVSAKDTFFDECPWIWKNFSEKGYITAYADDYTSVFSFRFGGFRRQPTDIYMEPFIQWYHNDKMHRCNKFGASSCIGNEMSVNLLQDHVRKTAAAMKGHPYFQFAWISRTHEHKGYAALADQSTFETLRHFESSGVLNESLVILVSDHGWRAGRIMSHPQARLENRLSFAFLLLPKWFQERYGEAYANLKENQYRLTSPYDIHVMLADMLDPSALLSDDAIRARTQALKNTSSGRGTSLFLPLSNKRSCADASIDEEWCACQLYDPIAPNSPMARQLGHFAVTTINSWLRPFPFCKKYVLNKILNAEVAIKPSTLSNASLQQFRVSFSVLPERDGARFEVTLFTDPQYWHSGNSSQISMSTEVYRLDRYSGAGCMNVYSMKKICTCLEES